MKIDVEKIKTAYEAASAEQKEQIEKMFPGAFECAKSEDPEETLETLVDKLKAWQDQNKDKRVWHYSRQIKTVQRKMVIPQSV